MEPVEIVILPAGKSLDVCAKLREEKKVKIVDGLHKRRKNGKKTSAVEGPSDMFEFLNTKVFARGMYVCIVRLLRPCSSGCGWGVVVVGSGKEQAVPLKKTGTATAARAENLNVKVKSLIV